MKFNCTFNDGDNFIAEFDSGSTFEGNFNDGVPQTAGVYNGSYDVIPKIEAQTLYTKDKLMLDDVNIRSIPRADVSNVQGGVTITIGGIE